MSWYCNSCKGEHPDSMKVCREASPRKIPGTGSVSRNARICSNCGSEIPGTYDYCPCQSHWEGFADR